MNCPDCARPLTKISGGNRKANGGMTGYRRCYNEDCSSYGRTAKMHREAHGAEYFVGWVDETELSMPPSEALRILRQMVRDDKAWFGELSDEAEQFARQTFRILF